MKATPMEKQITPNMLASSIILVGQSIESAIEGLL